jgi:hypothetical protein
MKCILMNFDDRVRVVPLVDKSQAAIQIGQAKECEVDPGIFDFIKRAMDKTQDPLIILPEAQEQPPEITELLDILGNMANSPYEDILRRASALVGQDNIGGPRPSLAEIRHKLRKIAQQFAHGMRPSAEAVQAAAAEIEARKKADAERERQRQLDLDPDERDRKLAEAREATRRAMQDGQVIGQMPTRELTERDKTDLDLGIIGGDANDLANALNRPPQGQSDPDAFDPSTARAPRPAKRSAKKAAKQAAKKPARGRAAKASTKRIRA